MDWLAILSYVLILGYVLLILAYLVGWLLIKEFKIADRVNEQKNKFSILIPIRNEAQVISKCLSDIAAQEYPHHQIEVIVIDDYSTDNTVEVVNSFIGKTDFPIRIIQMKDYPLSKKLKKAAITLGIEQSLNDYIILTDADCEREKRWLSTIDQFISNTQSKLIYAPVVFKANSVFEKIQSLEFAGLVGIGASAIQLKNPNMCSAANLIFEKAVFYEVEGYKGVDGIASGDDEFLMHKIFKVHPNKVQFLKHRDAIVSTSANTSIKQLTDQRRRWVSKSTKYENRWITFILVAAYIFNALIFIELFYDIRVGLQLLCIKGIIEGLFLYQVLRFFNRKSYLLFLPLAEVFHIIYVLIIGIWANIGTYQWKGRDLK